MGAPFSCDLALLVHEGDVVNLFQLGEFQLHSGAPSLFKIECDVLEEGDWQTLAWLATQRLRPFGAVEAVLEGGVPFAAALKPYASQGPLLIVDDVFTTGKSIETQRAGRDVRGVVAFARSPTPSWIIPIFQMSRKLGN